MAASVGGHLHIPPPCRARHGWAAGRSRLLPDSRLKGQANLLVMPNVEAANIAHNLLRAFGGGVSIGPIVIGAARSAHVVTQTITVRGIVNMTALAVAQVDAAGGARA